VAEAKRLVQMQKEHPELKVAGATTTTDAAAIAGFLEKAGGSFPVMAGLDAASKDAWGITGFPSVRVVKDGKRVGDRESAVETALGH
jgi:hypothetical protein